MRILVTAGATREPLDEVRFVSNVSSGATGAALADALRRLYEDEPLRIRLGEAARAAAANYSWQARAERIMQAIRIAVSGAN